MRAGTVFSAAVVLLSLAAHSDAHGYLKQPEPSWVDDPNVNWVVLIDNYWDIGSGGDQVGLYKSMAAEKGVSVRDVVLDMVGDQKCGNTVTDVDPKPVPSDGKAIWVGGEGGGGFTHRGPCELYIDDKMVLKSDDCSEDSPTDGGAQMSEMPVDYSSCNGNCMFTIYWLAFQNEQWQAYTDRMGSSNETTATEASSAEEQKEEEQGEATGAPTTEGSAPSTEATTPSAESESPETTTETEAPSTETQTNAPSTETKCTSSRRLRKKTTAN